MGPRVGITNRGDQDRCLWKALPKSATMESTSDSIGRLLEDRLMAQAIR
jgi:hypothetical protein